MPDMLVKLYDLPDNGALLERLRGQGIVIKRAMTGDKQAIVDFVGRHFTESWRNECEVAFAHLPVHCYIAVKQGEVIGFACHEVVMKNFFGPTGVLDDYRGWASGRPCCWNACPRCTRTATATPSSAGSRTHSRSMRRPSVR